MNQPMPDLTQPALAYGDEPTDLGARVIDRDGDQWARRFPLHQWGCLTTSSAPQAWRDLVWVCGPLRLAETGAPPEQPHNPQEIAVMAAQLAADTDEWDEPGSDRNGWGDGRRADHDEWQWRVRRALKATAVLRAGAPT